jgi:hypothetical protein
MRYLYATGRILITRLKWSFNFKVLSARVINPSKMFITSSLDDKAYKKALRKHLKQKRPPLDHDWTPFRAAEKRYKARFPPPDLRDVLDLSHVESRERNGMSPSDPTGNAHAIHTRQIRLRHEESKRGGAYTVPQIPGEKMSSRPSPLTL